MAVFTNANQPAVLPVKGIGTRAEAIFFRKERALVTCVVEVPGLATKNLPFNLPNDTVRAGAVVNTSSFDCNVGGKRYLYHLDESMVGKFDPSVRAGQVELPDGPYGKVPTTGIILMHANFLIIGYIKNSEPDKCVFARIETGGTNVAYGDGDKKAGFVMALSKAGFATLVEAKDKSKWVFFVPVKGAARSADVGFKVKDNTSMSLSEGGIVELSSNGEPVFSVSFVETFPGKKKQISRKKVLKDDPSDFGAGVVEGKQSIGFSTRGVVALTDGEMRDVAGDSNAVFKEEKVFLLGSDTSKANLPYVLITATGPALIEIPKAGQDSTSCELYTPRFGREGDVMEGYIVYDKRIFWIAKNGKKYFFNGFSEENKSGVTFEIPDGGKLTAKDNAIYVDGKPVYRMHGVPEGLKVKGIIEVGEPMGYVPVPLGNNAVGYFPARLLLSGNNDSIEENAPQKFERPVSQALPKHNEGYADRQPGKRYFPRGHLI